MRYSSIKNEKVLIECEKGEIKRRNMK